MTGNSIELLDEQIERMKGGGTLSENEVKILCDRVSAFKTEFSVAGGHDGWATSHVLSLLLQSTIILIYMQLLDMLLFRNLLFFVDLGKGNIRT